MAASDTSDSNRFVYRPPERKAQPYYIPITRSGSIIKPNAKAPLVLPTPMVIRSADPIQTRTEPEGPARRVVVIRTNKHPPADEEPVDLGQFEKSKSLNESVETTDGHKKLFLIRRPIVQLTSEKTSEYQSPLHDPSPVNSLENITTPTPPLSPPPEMFVSPNSPSSPPLRPKTSKPVENTQRYIPYLRKPRNRSRTVSPSRLKSTGRSPSPVLTRTKLSKRSTPPPRRDSPKYNESQEIYHRETIVQIHSPSPPMVGTEQQTIQYYPKSTNKNVRQKKPVRSAVVVSPNEPKVAILENSMTKTETSQPTVKNSKLIKRTRFEDEFKDESTEELMFQSRSQRCLGCLAKYMCLVIIICVLLILIGLAGVGVSAYFLATDTTNNLIPTVIGIAVGGVLAIAALCFLYIVLACLGARDGYFRYHRRSVRSGGRALAMIPPSHPNAHQYLPYDKPIQSDNDHVASTSNTTVSKLSTSFNQPVLTTSRANTSSNVYETKSAKHNVIIEMPEQLISQGQLSPRTRERSLTKIVRNIGHVVDDAKRRHHGDLPDRFVVKVDEDGTTTT